MRRFGLLASLCTVALGVIALGSGSPTAQTSTYYVRAGASGARNGSDWTNAFSALPTTLVRGATYYIADGTYGGHTFDDPVSGTTLITIKKATIADHGTDIGWNSTYGDGYWQLTVGGDGALPSDGTAINGGGALINGRFDVRSDYWVIDGNTDVIERYGFKVSSTVLSRGQIELGAADGTRISNATVRDVEMDGNGAAANFGMRIRGDSLLVSNVFIHSINEDPISMRASNTIVEHCRISDRVSGNGSHPDAIAFNGGGSLSQVDNSTIRYCVIDWNGQIIFFDGTASFHGTRYIYGNVLYDSIGISSKCLQGHSNNLPTTIFFYNNTCADMATSSITGFGSNTKGSFYNNIFYNVPTPGFPGSHDYNWFKTGTPVSETHAQFGTDPFTDSANHAYTLRTATHAGISLAATYAIDPDGKTRGADGTWDRGALECLSCGSGTTLPVPAPPLNVRIVR
jgi:hypothetical protein